MTFRASARGEWFGGRTFLYTSRAREGSGKEFLSRGIVSGALSCKSSSKEASLLFGCFPDEITLFSPNLPSALPFM